LPQPTADIVGNIFVEGWGKPRGQGSSPEGRGKPRGQGQAQRAGASPEGRGKPSPY